MRVVSKYVSRLCRGDRDEHTVHPRAHAAPIAWLATAMVACAPAVDGEPELDERDVEQAAGQALEAGWTDCSAEWQRCSFSGTRTVRYGANGVYTQARTFTGGVDCRNENFGGDPLVGATKRCELQSSGTPTTPTPPSSDTFSRCAAEWQRCSFSGTRTVRYGANGVYTSPRSFTGGVDCTNNSFGGDPVPNVLKQCEVSGAGTTPTEPTGPSEPSEPTAPVVTPPSGGTSPHVPYSRSNPILYTNDHPEDVHTDVIMMALQSNGSINLRGMVTDQQSSSPGGCGGDGCHTASYDDAQRRDWINAARQSGFRNIPDSVSGEAGVNLIISEARAASSSRPLVIMVGGPLTLVARAYQRDPSIASKVIVSFAGFSWNESNNMWRTETNVSNDYASAKTVVDNLRCVIVPFYDFNSKGIDQTRYPSTPRSRVSQLPNEPLRDKMLSIYAYPWAHYDADGGPQATLLSSGYATASKRVRWASDAGGVYLADDNNSDDILITSVNGGAATEAWWSEVNAAFAGN